MTHPHHLHALAAAWSLQAADVALAQRIRDNAADAIAGNTRDREISIPSQVFGRRYGLGGHGDPVGDLALATWRPPRPDPDVELLDDITRQLVDLAKPLPAASPPLDRIRAAIPTLTPATAGRLAVALQRLDDVIRRRLGTVGADRWPLAGQPCPACGLRQLVAQTSAPGPQWTVVCLAGCVCAGPGCPCQMPVRELGVRHIWAADHPLVRRTIDHHQNAA